VLLLPRSGVVIGGRQPRVAVAGST
jgi:hypothetical protein